MAQTDDADEEYRPTAQFVQTVASMLAVYFPAGQALQVAAPVTGW
jgi:hypothetical protein